MAVVGFGCACSGGLIDLSAVDVPEWERSKGLDKGNPSESELLELCCWKVDGSTSKFSRQTMH